MKKKRTKLFMCISFLIIGFLISTSSINTLNIIALVEEKNNYYTIDSLDQYTWKWNTTEVVSTESTNHSILPSLALDSAGNVHIAWYDLTDYAGSGTDGDIFYKRWEASTYSWITTEVVSTESTNHSIYPSLALDSTGNVHITWQDYTDYAGSGADIDIFYKRWEVSTSSWTTTEVVSTESTGDSESSSLAVDTLGDVYISWYDWTDYAGSGADIDIFYKRWEVSTSSWTTTEVVSTESTNHSVHPSLAVDTDGNIHIAWYDQTDYAGSGTDGDIFYKRWNASTSTWAMTEVVSTESTDYANLIPSLAVDTLGNVHIAWDDWSDYAGSGTDADIFYKYWNASSSSWTTTEVISTESTYDSLSPSLTVDSAGNVHITWEVYNIFYKRWEASTCSWTTTEVVSTESTDRSFDPSLAVDILGNVHITWQDETNYANAGTDWDIFYKRLVCSPTAPELASIVPNPTENDTVNLNWSNVPRATTYFVYRSTSCIWSVEGLVPLTTVSSSDYIDTVPSEGFYFYVVVAGNFAGNSSLSNCQHVYFEPLTPTPTPTPTPTKENSIGIGAIVIVIIFGLTSIYLKKRKSSRI